MVQVIEKPDWVSWDEIHKVIWKAHEANRKQGIVMLLPSLPGEDIRRCVEDGNGKMFIALDGKIVVGTAAVKRKKANLWCGIGDYAYFCFVSVLPEYRGQGIYKRLYNNIERESINNGLNRISFDTHERNTRIIEINLKLGFEKVSYKRCDGHFNIIFVKWLDNCPYSGSRFKVEFAIQKLKVKVKTAVRLVIHNRH